MENRFLFFLRNSNIHGLRYIVKSGSHWTERLFWILSCGVAAYFMCVWSSKAWLKFKNNPVGFVQDTSYLGWDTSYPAISVCETDSDLGAMSQLADRLYGPDHDPDIETFLKDIVFFEGKCYSCKTLCLGTLNCTEDFKNLTLKSRTNCRGLIKDCFWNGSPFDCCDAFKPLKTEIGTCYTINSIQTGTRYVLSANQTTGSGNLNFKATKDVFVYIHSEEDVPFLNHPLEEKEMVILGTKFQLIFQINEINNDPLLLNVPINIRKCKFPKERGLELYDHYSYSGCVVQCRANAQLEFCNCTHHFIESKGNWNTCGLSGLNCLTKNTKILGSLKTQESSKEGLVCECHSSCNEPDITVVSKSLSGNHDKNGKSTIDEVQTFCRHDEFGVDRCGQIRTGPKMLFSVNLGGISGLNFGASVLSIAEIFYFFLIRKKTKKVPKWRKKPTRLDYIN